MNIDAIIQERKERISKTKKLIRQNSRLIRAVRLAILCDAYSVFNKFELNRISLGKKESYQSAEATCYLLNEIFDGKVKPADLIKHDDERTETIIEKHKEFREWCNQFEQVFKLDKRVLIAFCKQGFYSGKGWFLRADSFQIKYRLNWILGYISNQTSKEALLENMVKISIFTQTKSPCSFYQIRRDIKSIESLYTVVLTKCMARELKNMKHNKVSSLEI